MNFDDYKYFVLCDGLFDAPFMTRTEANNYLVSARRKNRGHIYTIVDADSADDRELERLREEYEDYQYYLMQLEEEWER